MTDALPYPLQPPTELHYTIDASQSEYVKWGAKFIMDQVHGWCSYQKAEVLIDLILGMEPTKIVEIGVWGGKSLIPMAYALKEIGQGVIYGIDPWDPGESIQWVKNDSNINHWSWSDHEAVLHILMQKIDEFQLNDQVRLVRATSAKAPLEREIDILHIDGNHSEETSFFDVIKWAPQVKSGGWIIFDDMTWCENEIFTTARATQWLDKHCIKVAEFKEDCVWGVWYKP